MLVIGNVSRVAEHCFCFSCDQNKSIYFGSQVSAITFIVDVLPLLMYDTFGTFFFTI